MLKLVLVNLQGGCSYSKSITCFTAYWCIPSPVLYCQNETAIPLSATPSLDCRLNWYTTPNGGTANSTNPTHTTATGTTSYYVSQTNTLTGCEGERSEIIVIVNPRPVAPW
jgi:hypothetical protein